VSPVESSCGRFSVFFIPTPVCAYRAGDSIPNGSGTLPESEVLMKPSSSARKLADMIDTAIADHVITTTEYEEILHVANEDGIIDPEERALLGQLQEMIADKTVKRVAG
jgi:hypothetical protein